MKKLLYSFASSGELQFYSSIIALALMLSLAFISVIAGILILVSCIAQAQPNVQPPSAPISGGWLFAIGLFVGVFYLSHVGRILRSRFKTLHHHLRYYLHSTKHYSNG